MGRYWAVKRREFITLPGGVAAGWPRSAHAQQTAVPVIGWLGAAGPNDRLMAAFRGALAEAGYTEGRNVVIEYRWAEGRYDRMPAMAEELVRHRGALIVATPNPTALVAKGASATGADGFGGTDDPVHLGLV